MAEICLYVRQPRNQALWLAGGCAGPSHVRAVCQYLGASPLRLKSFYPADFDRGLDWYSSDRRWYYEETPSGGKACLEVESSFEILHGLPTRDEICSNIITECEMIIRSLAPRQCRRLLSAHGPRLFHSTRRTFQQNGTPVELPSNEAQVAEAAFRSALIEQTGIDVVSPQAHPEDEVDEIAHRDPKYVELQKREQRDSQRIEAYHTWNHLRHTTHKLGSQLEPSYNPIDLIRSPPRASDVTEELLLASQAHLGHSTSLWHPANSRYIFGVRSGVHIISLDVTAAHLRRAAKVVAGVAERGGLILFVGTRSRQDRIVVRAAEMAGACHLIERWIPGSITNGQQLLGRCRTKVVDEFDREIPGFEEQLMDRGVLKPDLVICLNPPENYVLLHECGLQGIPTIGIIDTDQDPTWVTYPIPANDDSLRSVQVIAGVLGRAGEEGQARRRTAAQHGDITFEAARNLTLPRVASNHGAPEEEDDGLLGASAPGQAEQGATQADRLQQPAPSASTTAASASAQPSREEGIEASERAERDVSVRGAKKEADELQQGTSDAR
ncbi:hypothetical protein FH972_022789 [Carpinus fangiana]|uniref:Small ribosomal subunit protein uS2c n=1 Tax=Carpinus fangiana TaxID=176857 RepID=A0A5N6KTN1_9ROSI|nr:hypothetical protein FH972_022789 [Carpinus fangiana]